MSTAILTCTILVITTGIALAATLVVWFVHYESSNMVRPDNETRGHWTAHKNRSYAVLATALAGALAAAFLIGGALSDHRYWHTIDTKLSARYGYDITHVQTRYDSYWLINGVPAGCDLYGVLPDDPQLNCLGLDQNLHTVVPTPTPAPTSTPAPGSAPSGVRTAPATPTPAPAH